VLYADVTPDEATEIVLPRRIEEPAADGSVSPAV
jgi:hypothetical protein